VAGATSWIAEIAEDSVEGTLLGGAAVAPFGVAALALGLPLWILGSQPPEPEESPDGMPPGPYVPDHLVYRSPPMIAGGAILLAAAAGGVVSSAVIVNALLHDHHDEVVPAVGYTLVGTIMLATGGIALVAYGAEKVAPAEASARNERERRPVAPTLRLGPGAALLQGEF
jgi:hypothetical protein